jgi:hypothetical protein
MLRALADRLTYANVVATLALFVALGGISYAAVKLPRNSVGTKHIKKGAITADKIRNGAVGSAKIRDGAIQAEDLDELPEGEPGRDGLDGRDGFDGADGAPGPPASPEFWAVVNADGTEKHGTATTVTKDAAGPGVYKVDFAADRRACAFLVSLVDGAGSAAAGAGGVDTEDVVVRTFDAAGAAADKAFNLNARC